MRSAPKPMRSEIKVEYVLEGGPELRPDEITTATGLLPSDVRKIGDVRMPNVVEARSRFNSWALESGLPVTSQLTDHVGALLDRLQPAWSQLKDFGAKHEAFISCIIYSYGGDRPAIYFDKDTIKRIAELHAGVDIDLYVLF